MFCFNNKYKMYFYLHCAIFFIFCYQIENAASAVPIDIEIQTAGENSVKKEPKFFTMIPDKDPLISRRRENVKKYDYYRDYYYNLGPKDKLGLDASHYIDDLDLPFLMPHSRNPVPSVGHGADIKFGQVLRLLKRMIVGNNFNNDMDALRDYVKRKNKEKGKAGGKAG